MTGACGLKAASHGFILDMTHLSFVGHKTADIRTLYTVGSSNDCKHQMTWYCRLHEVKQYLANIASQFLAWALVV